MKPAFSLLLLLVFTSIIPLQSQIFLPGMQSGQAGWIDYNGDDTLDLLFTGTDTTFQGKTELFYQSGGTFQNSGIVFPPLQWSTFDWADYDGDGDPDLLLAGHRSQNLSLTQLYRNDSSLGFTLLNTPFPGIAHGVVHWGDVEGDGDQDVWIVGFDRLGGYFHEIWTNDGASNFTKSATLEGYATRHAEWTDADGDGDLDIILAGTSEQDVFEVAYFRNDGVGNWTKIKQGLPDWEEGSVTWGNVITSDPFPELFVTGYDDGELRAGLYDFNGFRFTPISYNFAGAIDGDCRFGDFDGDGIADLALTGVTANGQEVIFYKNNGSGGFSLFATFSDGAYNSGLDWGDCDNDGDLDLLMIGTNSQGIPETVIYKYLDIPPAPIFAR